MSSLTVLCSIIFSESRIFSHKFLGYQVLLLHSMADMYFILEVQSIFLGRGHPFHSGEVLLKMK